MSGHTSESAGGPAAGAGEGGGGIRVAARDVTRPLDGLATGQTHRIAVVRVAVPVIFVPGIMGSRLGRVAKDEVTGEVGFVKVWDPDDLAFMSTTFYSQRSRAAQKREWLIKKRYDPNDLVPYHPWHLKRYRVADGSQGLPVGARLTSWAIEGACAEQQRFSALSDDEVARGWTSLSLASYRPVLKWFQASRFLDRLPTIGGAPGLVAAPVHAFGYNWTASCARSGELLAQYVREVVRAHRDAGRECPGVVLVTHSMGGLVARSACVVHNAPNVLAVVHGVQPVDGAAAAYWRMKAGFPRPPEGFSLKATLSSRILGTDGHEVTALLGNMPGALELLPNQLYGTPAGQPQWLQWPDEDRTVALPSKGDPYQDIYLNRTDPWRLVPDESWLDPAGTERKMLEEEVVRLRGREVGRSLRTPWSGFIERVGQAQELHEQIGGKQHPRTASFFGRGVPTPATVRFDARLVQIPPGPLALAARDAGRAPAAVGGAAAGGVAHGPASDAEPGPPLTADQVCRALNRRTDEAGAYRWFAPVRRNGRTDYPFDPDDGVWRYSLLPSDEDGDGTVPTVSGRALCWAQGAAPGTRSCPAYDGLEHEPAYQREDVLKWVTASVVGLIGTLLRPAAGGPR